MGADVTLPRCAARGSFGVHASVEDEELIRERVLPHYPGWEEAAVAPLLGGLINRTLLLERADARAVLQQVNPIFSPRIHENIAAVTARLAEAGVATPRLVRTRAGGLFVDAGEHGVWRMLTHMSGVGFDAVADARQARSASVLIARFHRALDGLRHEFVGLRANVHDTPAHLRRLAEAAATARAAPARPGRERAGARDRGGRRGAARRCRRCRRASATAI